MLAVLLLVCAGWAETRPRYGGTLQVQMRAATASLDPAAAKDAGLAQIAPLIYDTLVGLDATGTPEPSLAVSWTEENERRWWIALRRGARFSDGTGVTSAVVAESLQKANPDWSVRAIGESVVIEAEQPLANLPATLALARNSIVLRVDGKLLGTGPFRVTAFDAGRRLSLAAVDEGWHARPFVDGIDIQLNRGTREQITELEAGRADVVEAAPDQFARITQSGRRVFAGDLVDLLALRFSHSNVRDARVREAIALTIDRESIVNVLMQRHAEADAGLLPNWMTGYAFLFATTPQPQRARELRAEARQAAPLTLVYAAADPLERLVAERIALNAADARITLKVLPSTRDVTVPDVELVRLRLPSTDPALAISELAQLDRLALPVAETIPETPAGLYQATRTALRDFWAVPIAYLPAAHGVSARVRNWRSARDGGWRLEEVWLAGEGGRP